MEQVIQYLHACTVSKTKETWLKAIGFGNYTKWTGLTIMDAKKYYPESQETPKGHMRKISQGVVPTKENKWFLQPAEDGTEINVIMQKH